MRNKEWKKYKLSNITSKLGDGLHGTPKYDNNGEYYFINGNNLENGKIVIKPDTKRVSFTEYQKYKKELNNNTILLSINGTLGNIGYYNNEKVILGKSACYFNLKDGFSKDYVRYIMSTKSFKLFLENFATGATIKNVSLDAMRNFEFYAPRKDLQDKIAKILSNYDNLIENNNKRIKILEEMAQKIYKEWFVDFKFPGHETTTIKESVLSSIITPIKGKNITKSKAKIGNVPVVGGGIEPAYYHNVANTQAPVITISASGANAGFVNLYYKDIWASDCSYIDATMTNYIYYTYLLLKNNQIEITNMQLGAAQPHVYPRDLVNLKIKEFPIEVVANFEKMISPIFENIKVLSNKNENLKQTRDILLPRLISGEINVENMEVL